MDWCPVKCESSIEWQSVRAAVPHCSAVPDMSPISAPIAPPVNYTGRPSDTTTASLQCAGGGQEHSVQYKTRHSAMQPLKYTIVSSYFICLS